LSSLGIYFCNKNPTKLAATQVVSDDAGSKLVLQNYCCYPTSQPATNLSTSAKLLKKNDCSTI
jgi:hypothetical protein